MATYKTNIQNYYDDAIITVTGKKITILNNGVFSVMCAGLILLPNESFDEQIEGDNDLKNEIQIRFLDFLQEYNNDVRLSPLKSLQIRTIQKLQ
jgi:hypothetical protein